MDRHTLERRAHANLPQAQCLGRTPRSSRCAPPDTHRTCSAVLATCNTSCWLGFKVPRALLLSLRPSHLTVSVTDALLSLCLQRLGVGAPPSSSLESLPHESFDPPARASPSASGMACFVKRGSHFHSCSASQASTGLPPPLPLNTNSPQMLLSAHLRKPREGKNRKRLPDLSRAFLVLP